MDRELTKQIYNLYYKIKEEPESNDISKAIKGEQGSVLYLRVKDIVAQNLKDPNNIYYTIEGQTAFFQSHQSQTF